MPTLRPPEELERSTLDVWRSLFCTFHLECGYQHGPSDAKSDAYWMKLQNFPEKILINMFDTFLRDRKDRCPPVGEMVETCRRELAFYRQLYIAQEKLEHIEKEEREDPDMIVYREAVKKAVFAILKQRPMLPEIKRKELIREAVYRVADEFGFEPLTMWLPKNEGEKDEN